jgi:membrane protease YdiL (CAAX protease family)
MRQWINRLSERTRWSLHLVILCCPTVLAMIPVAIGHHAALPHNIFQLAWFLLVEFLTWGTAFVVAFRISGITASQLRLETRHALRVVCYGFLWFLVIRASSIPILWTALKWIDPKWLWATEEKIFSFTDAQNIMRHPVFSFFVYGVVSLIAGFTEELWRAGMLIGLEGIFPQLKGKGLGSLAGIIIVSVVFGLGHLYQGWFGVGNAILLGFFLGLILVYRNSYWETAITHTLIDASAFGVIIVLMLNKQFLGPQIVYSASRGDLQKVEHLVNMGGDINATSNAGGDWKGVTALEEAAQRPNPEMVRFLLEKGANPNVKDSHGETPLIVATEQNQLQNMKLLISKGANINSRNNRGFTALRSAAEYNRLEAARFLIDSGADLNLTDNEEKTPLAAANQRGYVNLVNLLQQKGGR